MNLKKIMKCTDTFFIINTTVFHQKIRIVNFDFMPTLRLLLTLNLTFILTGCRREELAAAVYPVVFSN